MHLSSAIRLNPPRPFLITLIVSVASFSLAAALLAATLTTGCGSHSSQQSTAGVPPGVPPSLPPAIPSAEPVLLYVGAGTSAPDVSALETVLGNLSLGYTTLDTSQMNALSQQKLGGYKLILIPGGNSITIGENLNASTVSAIQGAVEQYGAHYLGVCAGAFFGGYSIYNGVNLTGGVSFNFYADEFAGIHEAPVEISFPTGAPLDMYWQDGPQLSGWGDVVAKFPDGTAAITEGQSGNGFVIFTGIHPEAPASWRGSLTFTTPVSVDVAYAGTVIQAALSGTPLPHF